MAITPNNSLQFGLALDAFARFGVEMVRIFRIKGEKDFFAALWSAALVSAGHEALLAHIDIDEGLGAELLDDVDGAVDTDWAVDDVHVFRANADAAAVVVKDIHRRRSDEAGDELVDRGVVKLTRGRYLLQYAIFEHSNAITHGHRFNLVVRDINRGGAEALLQAG